MPQKQPSTRLDAETFEEAVLQLRGEPLAYTPGADYDDPPAPSEEPMREPEKPQDVSEASTPGPVEVRKCADPECSGHVSPATRCDHCGFDPAEVQRSIQAHLDGVDKRMRAVVVASAMDLISDLPVETCPPGYFEEPEPIATALHHTEKILAALHKMEVSTHFVVVPRPLLKAAVIDGPQSLMALDTLRRFILESETDVDEAVRESGAIEKN